MVAAIILGRLLAEVDDEVAARVREAVSKALESHASDAGIEMGYATWLVSATRGEP